MGANRISGHEKVVTLGSPCVSPPQDECHNYIRVLVPRDAETLLACGTNAFSPLCRTYQVGVLGNPG